ncbi:hypothetical protein BN946_scf184867.g20 [Trametes cinnabarina]|uniref:Uncharacterized protein n=1 Tax=Pycnoporus cinnabarinus TaxID=5643 RepID=A0A060SIU1_PYCCI|nr:hypothetical protein BN946_scf184867.g20 [Trametes cinnabarina]
MGPTVLASAVNRTIDDQNGDSVTGVVPSYSPAGDWSQGSTCSGCFIHLDTSQTFQGTWHDTTHTPGDSDPRVITAQFTGTAVYVYNVLANTVPWTTTFTSITFTLDGKNVGQFVHVPTDSTDFQYNVPVFASDNLPNTDHTIVIEANGATNSSLVLFDYIVYTFEDDPTTTSSQPAVISSSSTTTGADPPTTTTSSTSFAQQTTPTSTSPTSSSTTSGSGANPTLQQISSQSGSTTSSLLHLSSPGAVSTSPAIDGASPSSLSNSVSPTQGPSAVASAQNDRIAVGAIAGGVVGGVAVLALAVLLALCCSPRRRRYRSASARPRPLIDSAASVVERNYAQTRPMLSNDASQTRSYDVPAIIGGSAVHTPYADGAVGVHHTPGPGMVASWRESVHDATDLRPGLSQNLLNTSADTASFPDVPSVPHRPTLPGVTTTSFDVIPPEAVIDLGTDVKPPLDDTNHMGVVCAPPTIPTAPSSYYSRSDTNTVSTIGERSLRAQVAALREEVERLREIREMQELFEEAPPRYGEP